MRTKQYGFTVGRPAVNLIVVAPARIQRAARGVERELLRNATRDGNNVDLFVAIVLPGERDPFAVRRKLGETPLLRDAR